MQCRRGRTILILFILSGMMALTGCGDEEASGGVTDVADALFLSENETGMAAETVDGNGASVFSADTSSEVSEIPVAAEGTSSAQKAQKLSEEDCRKMEDFLNEVGSYGFLLSVYEKPQDLDAEQVFYIGAGLAELGVSQEERDAYLEETGEEEAPNLFRLGAHQISDHLQYRAGISTEDLTKKPGWVYLEAYDAYYQAHGDEETNICRFEVTDAAVQGDYYRVHYRVKNSNPETNGWHVPVYETILKKNGDSYRFCVNRIWEEKDLLLCPFCSVELEPFGTVDLCAYEPGQGSVENADVTFELIQNGKVVAVLPGVNELNIRPNMTFEDVVAVDTADYDDDGKKEILTICEYRVAREGNGRQDGMEARIYRFSDEGTPEYDLELSSKINQKVKTLSISGISSFIRTGKDRGLFKSREEAFAAEIESIDEASYDRFALIYVNDDREPELLEMGTTLDKGAKIIFYDNGVLEETKVSSDFSYLSKENLLLSKSGTKNLFKEALYVYAGNSLNIYLSGTYGTMDAATTAYSEDGKPQYTYTWEGSPVTEAGYRDALFFVYNAQKAVDASKIETVSADELLRQLKKN